MGMQNGHIVPFLESVYLQKTKRKVMTSNNKKRKKKNDKTTIKGNSNTGVEKKNHAIWSLCMYLWAITSNKYVISLIRKTEISIQITLQTILTTYKYQLSIIFKQQPVEGKGFHLTIT